MEPQPFAPVMLLYNNVAQLRQFLGVALGIAAALVPQRHPPPER
jgi:hypothetical protein